MAAIDFARITELTPAYDRRREPGNGGIHGVELRMALKGPDGTIVWVLFTNWMLREVREEWFRENLLFDHSHVRTCFLPLPAYLQVHSPRPLREGHEPSRDILCGPRWLGVDPVQGPIIEPAKYGDLSTCHYLDGRPCYLDSWSTSDEVFELLLREGDQGVWRELERRYLQTFQEVAQR